MLDQSLNHDDLSFLEGYNRLTHADRNHENYVVVNWCISNVCNYKCSYCPEGLHNGSDPFPQLDTVMDFCSRVIDHYGDKKVYFEFTGGEMTLWKELPDLAKYLRERGGRVGIISNASRSEKYWSELIPLLDHVCLSYHPETGRADHFYKIVSLCSSAIRTHVNFMMHPDYFAECMALAYKVKDLPDISMAIQPLVVDMGDKLFNYTEAQTKVIDTQNNFLAKQIKYQQSFESYRGAMTMHTPGGKTKVMSPQRFISSSKNSWKGWQCSVGLEQIVINTRGVVYRGWCQVGGRIGHISDKALSLPNSTVLCNKSYCHCNLDIMTTKEKPPKKTWMQKFLGGGANA